MRLPLARFLLLGLIPGATAAACQTIHAGVIPDDEARDASTSADTAMPPAVDGSDANALGDADASSDAGDGAAMCMPLHAACTATTGNDTGDCCGQLRCQGASCCVPGGQPGKVPCRRNSDCCGGAAVAVNCSGVDPNDAADDGGVGTCFIAAAFK